MGGGTALSSSAPPLPPPCPRSPPVCPDLSGRRREMVKIQLLERERSFLEGELKYIEGLQPASTCCKEVVELVDTKADPFIPIKKKKKKKISKRCRLWKWICESPCLILSWICCCSFHLKRPACPSCNCSLPRPSCTPSCSCPCPCSCCCPPIQCPKCCCKFQCPCNCGIACPNCTISNMFSCFSCPNCPSSACCANTCPSCQNLNCCSCPKWTTLCCCFNCRKNCCNPTICCLCF